MKQPKTRIAKIDYDNISLSQAIDYKCQKYALYVELSILWGLIKYEVVIATADTIQDLEEMKV